MYHSHSITSLIHCHQQHHLVLMLGAALLSDAVIPTLSLSSLGPSASPRAMHPRHPTAADRARARKRSTAPTHASSDESPKQQRIQPNSVNDENVNTINTQSASLVAPHSPSASSSAVTECCECGHCPPAPAPDSGDTLEHCCWHIEPAGRLPVDSPPLCERADVASVIDDGVSDTDYAYFSPRIRGPDRPASFAACSAAQKRLMLYAVLNRMLYGQGSKGQRNPLPGCITHMVRSQCVDDEAHR